MKLIKKLNNKGLSIVEILVCFVIVAVVSITLLNTLMEYKSEEQIEVVKNHVESYKNTITRVIQSDITDYALLREENATYTQISKNTSKFEITLVFQKSFKDGSNSKKLIIYASDNENYISYPDIVEQSNGIYAAQEVKYYLEESAKIIDDEEEVEAYKQKNDIRFAHLNINTVSVKDGNTITIDIPIVHNELGTEYHIKIVAPLGLLSSYEEKEPENCTITYVPGTGAVSCPNNPQTMAFGETLSNVCSTTKTGYTLSSWKTGDNCSGKVITTCNKVSIYAYACWIAKQYTLTLVTDGTYNGSKTRTMTYGSKNNNNVGAATKSGYTFDGWYTAQTGGTKVYDKNGKNVQATGYWTAAWDSGTWKKDSDVTLYSRFVSKKSTISFDGNGATKNADPTSVEITYGTNTFNPTSLTSLPEKKYSVSAVNTGSTSTRKSTGATITGTTNLISNYTFDGWSVAPRQALSAAPKLVKNTKTLALGSDTNGFIENGKWIKEGNVKVYAIWTPKSVTLPTVTKTGYTCGWTASSTGTSITYESGATITPTSNTLLYAVCEPKSYKLTYNLTGGTGTCATLVKNYDETWGTLCSNVTRENYDFVDWVKSGSTGTKLTGSTKVTGDVTALANWSSCNPDGNWSNTSSKIKIYSLYSTTSYYRKVTKENEDGAYTSITTDKTGTSSAYKHYKFHYKSEGSSYYHWCYSKYDNLIPNTPEVWDFKWDSNYTKPSNTTVKSDCEADSTRTTEYECTVTIKTPASVNHYYIGWLYNFSHDQSSTYVNGHSGRQYEYVTYTYDDNSTCSTIWRADEGKYKDANGNYTISDEDDICSDGYRKMVVHTKDYAGNTSKKLIVNFKWIKN